MQDNEAFEGADEALRRMHRAFQRGTGCYLTPEMIRSLKVTVIGEWWANVEPSSGCVFRDLNVPPPSSEGA